MDAVLTPEAPQTSQEQPPLANENELVQEPVVNDNHHSIINIIQESLPDVFAAPLLKRYDAWLKTSYADHADRVATVLLDHARQEALSLLAWEFLLDFYWHGERPFMPSPTPLR